MKPLIDHRLLTVVGPALDNGGGAKHLACIESNQA
jgi:hypothetical protein